VLRGVLRHGRAALSLVALGSGPATSDHDLDHLPRDRERDRPLRRDTGLRRRADDTLNSDPAHVAT